MFTRNSIIESTLLSHLPVPIANKDMIWNFFWLSPSSVYVKNNLSHMINISMIVKALFYYKNKQESRYLVLEVRRKAMKLTFQEPRIYLAKVWVPWLTSHIVVQSSLWMRGQNGHSHRQTTDYLSISEVSSCLILTIFGYFTPPPVDPIHLDRGLCLPARHGHWEQRQCCAYHITVPN